MCIIAITNSVENAQLTSICPEFELQGPKSSIWFSPVRLTHRNPTPYRSVAFVVAGRRHCLASAIRCQHSVDRDSPLSSYIVRNQRERKKSSLRWLLSSTVDPEFPRLLVTSAPKRAAESLNRPLKSDPRGRSFYTELNPATSHKT